MMMDYKLIAEKDEYALIQREAECRYAVVNGHWIRIKGMELYTCSYYGFGKYPKLSADL